jgi:hypothetical protein
VTSDRRLLWRQPDARTLVSKNSEVLHYVRSKPPNQVKMPSSQLWLGGAAAT